MCNGCRRLLGVGAGLLMLCGSGSVAAVGQVATAAPTMAATQYRYYGGQYQQAAALAAARLDADPDDLAARELRTAALLFQVKRLVGDGDGRRRRLESCATCPDLIAAFQADVDEGRRLARARLAADAEDREAKFFLARLDLNYIWMQLEPLDRRTGWSEFREARGLLNDVLEEDPGHVRARIARAWIDYVIDTRVPWVFRWVLGGGDRRGALRAVRETAEGGGAYYDRVEARFALWEMLAREEAFDEAAALARDLLGDFPDNAELVRFAAEHGGSPVAGP